MGALYPGTSVSGYNSNPPPDDGSTVSTNLITWSGIKSKIGDPLNTFDTSVDSNITSAFGKTIDGASVVSTAVNYAATSADQGRLISVTVSGKTVTTPDAGTVGAPFIFGVTNQSAGTITLAPNATNSQTLDGSTAGNVVQAGGSCFAKTDGTNWFSIAYKPGSNTLAPNNYGFCEPVNANISCSVGSNLLTVALKTKAGNDPSASDPVQVAFRDTTIANGDPVWVTINSALSINTNATGASLGSQSSNIPFRFWVLLFNNSGTAVLALWQSGAGSSAISLNPLNEGTLQSTSGISAAATSAGTFYTPNGTSLTSKAFRILGYLDYTTGLATAGTYASAPTIVQLFGPGIKKPGDVVQSAYATATAQTSVSSATKTVTNTVVSISPTSATNPVRVAATGVMSPNGSATADFAQLGRNSNANLFGTIATTGAGTTVPVALDGFDYPGSTSSQTYGVYIAGDGTHVNLWLGTLVSTATQSTIVADEIMG